MNREERKAVPWGESQEPGFGSKQKSIEENRERKAAVSGGTMEQRAFADWSEIDLFL